MYVYEFKYTTHDGKTGTYQKQYDKLLSDQETQKELQKIFYVFNDVKSAILTRINEI